MKRVFILGAGSSIGHSTGLFPKINTFFKVARNNDLEIDLADEYKSIFDYIKTATGKDILIKSEDVDIEAIFTYLEIEIERNPSPELIRIREKLLHFIQQVLLGLSNKLKSSDGEYQLLEKILKETDDTIITFNWDLLLDNILSRVGVLRNRYQDTSEDFKGLYWNFILDLSAFGEGTYRHASIIPPYHEWKSERGYYLKMHGSIDWFYCSNDHCRAYLKTFPVLESDKPHYCSECHEQLKCLIIPPVLNKSYRKYPIIRRIWNLAAKELSIAEELIIWGYSLPPTDFYASWLLSQARQAPLNRIHIINPAVFSSKNRRIISKNFIRRFYNIFRDRVTVANLFLYEDFSSFVKDTTIFKSYKLGKITETLKSL